MLKLSELRLRAGLTTVLGVALIAGAVLAQTAPQGQPPAIEWDKRRLDQLDRNVRKLERALTQRNAQGQPVVIEPDPEVIALQGQVETLTQRVSDLEQTLRRVNGDVEEAALGAEERSRENTALRRQLSEFSALAQRLNARLTALEEAAARSPTGSASGDLAAANALAADDPAKRQAYQNLIESYPDAPETREANYRLADLAAGSDTAAAVPLYARALSGWPTTPWAAEATLKLAAALVATEQKPQACGAIGEFSRRYAERATAAQRTRAGQLRTQAECAAAAAPAAGTAAQPTRPTTGASTPARPRGGAG